jgi:hypothetical protein
MLNRIKMKENELEDEFDNSMALDEDPVANINESIRPLFFKVKYEGS